MAIQTNTFTFTKVRLELIVDEFEALLLRAGASDWVASGIAEGVSRRMCTAIALWAGKDEGGSIVVSRKVQLNVDWHRHDEFMGAGRTSVALDARVWEGGASPETRVAVRQFRAAVDRQALDWGIFVTLADAYKSSPALDEAVEVMHLGTSRRERWSGPVQRTSIPFEEVPELTLNVMLAERRGEA
jgi:hypothetical protein